MYKYWIVLEGKFVGNSGWQDLGYYEANEFGELMAKEIEKYQKDLADFKKGNERQEFRSVFWREKIKE